MYACGPQICTSALQGKFLNNKAQIIKLKFFTHSLSSSGCFTYRQNHRCVPIDLFHCMYTGQAMTHTVAPKGHVHVTRAHTHTHSHWDCMHDCMHLQSNTDKQACTCTKTHIHRLALPYTNTYTGSGLTLALFHSCKHTQTRAHTHAERGGQMESQRGLLAFHTLETWFLTVSSPSPTLIPLFPHPTYPLSSSRSHLCQHTSPCFFFRAALSFCSLILALYISINSRCQLSMHLSSLFSLPCH